VTRRRVRDASGAARDAMRDPRSSSAGMRRRVPTSNIFRQGATSGTTVQLNQSGAFLNLPPSRIEAMYAPEVTASCEPRSRVAQ
jgi:hypothetical protein